MFTMSNHSQTNGRPSQQASPSQRQFSRVLSHKNPYLPLSPISNDDDEDDEETLNSPSPAKRKASHRIPPLNKVDGSEEESGFDGNGVGRQSKKIRLQDTATTSSQTAGASGPQTHPSRRSQSNSIANRGDNGKRKRVPAMSDEDKEEEEEELDEISVAPSSRQGSVASSRYPSVDPTTSTARRPSRDRPQSTSQKISSGKRNASTNRKRNGLLPIGEAGESDQEVREEEDDALVIVKPGQSSRAVDRNAGPSQGREHNGETGEENDAEGSDYEADMIEGEDGAMYRKKKVAKMHLVRGADGYIVGSIVRVRLENFVTYDFTEFAPGPYLNMIIGPNGTGKSTIVCGMAIGLGWQPKMLGRASIISDYVKQGKDNASTEIELKSPNGQRNIIIKRKFKKQNKKSDWELNGQPATYQKIADKVGEMGIQLGNLCAFLPQDKVAEFAQMSPEMLLAETMKAAGDPGLTGWHDTLIKKGRTFGAIRDEKSTTESNLMRVNRRIDELQPVVDALQERKQLTDQVQLLERLLPLARLNKMGQDKKVARLQRDRQKIALETAVALSRPVVELQE